jgi:hypothetical protein
LAPWCVDPASARERGLLGVEDLRPDATETTVSELKLAIERNITDPRLVPFAPRVTIEGTNREDWNRWWSGSARKLRAWAAQELTGFDEPAFLKLVREALGQLRFTPLAAADRALGHPADDLAAALTSWPFRRWRWVRSIPPAPWCSQTAASIAWSGTV